MPELVVLQKYPKNVRHTISFDKYSETVNAAGFYLVFGCFPFELAFSTSVTYLFEHPHGTVQVARAFLVKLDSVYPTGLVRVCLKLSFGIDKVLF